NPPANKPPVVTAPDVMASKGQLSFAASWLIKVSDADNDTIAKYQLFDATTDAASGFWALNGAAQGSMKVIDVSPAQLGQTTFQMGSLSDVLAARAFDRHSFPTRRSSDLNPPANKPPVVTAPDVMASKGQ